MEGQELPSRLFQTGFEPVGRKRVNSYFNLRWIELIKLALDAADLEMLQGTQFATILRMGGHTFSVMFAHYFLSRQLVTEKEFELWWTFAGKPIRYGIEDFALVTGLNCEEPPDSSMSWKEKVVVRVKGNAKGKGTTSNLSIWEALFGGEARPTPNWIMDKLILGKRYKDSVTRLRLALLVLVEGILCPTCGSTKIRPEVVHLLGNIDEFLKYPWGRESFLLTVKSAKPRSPLQYVQETIAIQGFVHAMVLVTLTACPAILVKAEDGADIADDNRRSEEIVESLVSGKLAVNVPWAKTVDQKGQANVRACINSDARAVILHCGLEDVADDKVDYMVSLIADEHPFEHNTWTGGVKADDVKLKKVVIEDIDGSEGNQVDETVGKEDSRTGIDSGVDRTERFTTPTSPVTAPATAPATTPRDDASRGVDSTALLRLEQHIQGIKDHFDLVTDGIQKELAAAVKAIGDLERIVRSAVEKGLFFSIGEPNMDDMGNPMSPVHGSSASRLHTSYVSPVGGGQEHRAVQKDSFVDQNVASVLSDGISPPLVPSHKPFTSFDKDSLDLHNPASKIPAVDGGQVPNREERVEPIIIGHGAVEKGASHVQNVASEIATGNSPTRVPVPNPITATSVEKDSSDLHSDASQIPGGGEVQVPNRAESVDPFLTEHGELEKDSSDLHHAASEMQGGGEGLVPNSEEGLEPCITAHVSLEKETTGTEDVSTSEPTESDKPLQNEAKEGHGCLAATAGALDGFRRYSSRRHNTPQRYTPPPNTIKKKVTTKRPSQPVDHPAKAGGRVKKVKTSNVPRPPLPAASHVFIGGFKPFVPPSPFKRATFLHAMEEAKAKQTETGPGFFVGNLLDLFHCNSVCYPQVVDSVISFIRKRRDTLTNVRFDFMPSCFFMELLRNYPVFAAVEGKKAFNFSALLQQQFKNRPKWFTEVDFVYSPLFVSNSFCVGVIVDLKMWAIYVVDANTAFPSEFTMNSLLEKIAGVLPYLLARYCETTRPQELNYVPMPISRLEIPLLFEHPGFSTVLALMLLEFHAAGKELHDLALTEDDVRAAAENYAIETLDVCQAGSPTA